MGENDLIVEESKRDISQAGGSLGGGGGGQAEVGHLAKGTVLVPDRAGGHKYFFQMEMSTMSVTTVRKLDFPGKPTFCATFNVPRGCGDWARGGLPALGAGRGASPGSIWGRHSPPPSRGCSWIPPPPAGKWFLRCSSSWISGPHLGKEKPEARVGSPGGPASLATPRCQLPSLRLCPAHGPPRAQRTGRRLVDSREGLGLLCPPFGGEFCSLGLRL